MWDVLCVCGFEGHTEEYKSNRSQTFPCTSKHLPRLISHKIVKRLGMFVPHRVWHGKHPVFPGLFRRPQYGRKIGLTVVKPNSRVSPFWGGVCGRVTAREARPLKGLPNRVRKWTRSCVLNFSFAYCIHVFHTVSGLDTFFCPSDIAYSMCPYVPTVVTDSFACSIFQEEVAATRVLSVGSLEFLFLCGDKIWEARQD